MGMEMCKGNESESDFWPDKWLLFSTTVYIHINVQLATFSDRPQSAASSVKQQQQQLVIMSLLEKKNKIWI